MAIIATRVFANTQPMVMADILLGAMASSIHQELLNMARASLTLVRMAALGHCHQVLYHLSVVKEDKEDLLHLAIQILLNETGGEAEEDNLSRRHTILLARQG